VGLLLPIAALGLLDSAAAAAAAAPNELHCAQMCGAWKVNAVIAIVSRHVSRLAHAK
jgi:hypothetical protein